MKNPSAAPWALKWAFPQTKECSPFHAPTSVPLAIPSPQFLQQENPSGVALVLGSRRHLKGWLGE